MIPLRILLQGFLCYREKTEIHFDDSSLWMLAGLNGSGKSAVFDAVTYALFGGHRGGQRNAEELINKESDGLVVELDFLRGGEVYRIKRTLKKAGRSTRQVLHHAEADGPVGRPGHNGRAWQPVENTANQRGFDDWVRDNIGLNYDTFTSSVLLMQGRAEKLLNSDAGERRKVLAGIVDLERYEKLHRRADERRKQFRDKADDLQQKLNLVADVTEEELAAADGRIAAGEAALEAARAEVERRQRLKVQGERWADLRGKVAEATRRWNQARDLLAHAEGIEAAWARLRRLREALPHLRTVLEQRQRLQDSETAAAGLAEERGRLAARLEELTYAEEQARGKREALERETADGSRRQQEVGWRLVELSGVLARAALCEQQRQAVAGLEAELGHLPADPAGDLAREQEAFERLDGLRQALPYLARLREERDGLREAGERARRAAAEEADVTARGTQLAIELRNLHGLVEAATAARRQADDWAAEARTLLNEAGKQLEELHRLEGAKVCRHCGQALTLEHLEAERQRRAKARLEAEKAFRQADEARKAAAQEEKHLQEEHRAKDQRINALREQHRDCKARRTQAEQDVARHARECGRVYGELPETFRLMIAPTPPDDWLATTYPAAEEMAALRRQAEGLKAARQRVLQAREVMERWQRLHAQRETARQALAAQEAGLPADVPALRREHGELEQESAALETRLKEYRLRLSDEQTALEALGKQRDEARQGVADRERRLEGEQVRQEACREAVARARAALPADWQAESDALTADRLGALSAEQAELERQGAEARAQELQQARERLESLRRDREERQREMEAVPEEAQREPAELEEQLRAAVRQQKQRDEELSEARNARRALTDRRRQREDLQRDFLEADGQYNRYKILAELLGPKRLQLHLVRQAEQGIVDYANEVLDRLSGGQLYLRLRREEGEEVTDKALDLEAYNRTAGEAPIGVAFLSGSQRFRVAVSLALGIGQYASHQHRPIESVIIDEGFGCLDRHGRQVMIQELQNLRDHMRCILLVSHQDEFAEAFANGYRFELANGTTQVTRFQR